MKGVMSSEEVMINLLMCVMDAKKNVETASVSAANAVTHCEELWGKLNSVESQLISTAAAIADAASVAKAAGAAAKVAVSALQGKSLADETGKQGVVVPSSAKSSTDVPEIQNATPASILKSESSFNEPNSILEEAAKRRVEAASATSKQAVNIEAIVKAAELAASDVSQAGKIIAMGEPLSLVDLIEAGPDGDRKLTQTRAETEADNSFTFKVNAIPDTTQESETSWGSFQDADKCNPTIVVNESIPPCKRKMEKMHSPKRKKLATTDHSPSASASGSQTVLVDALHSLPVGVSACALPQPATLGSCVADDSTVCSLDPYKKCDPDTMKGVTSSVECLKNVLEAKNQAENASDLAANAVIHCEDLRGKLAKEMGSVYGGVSLLCDAKMIPPELHSSDSKTRKRKKLATTDHSPSASASGSQTVLVDTLHSSPVGVSARALPQPATLGSCVADDSTVCSLDPYKKCESDTMKGVTSSVECLENVLETKNQAENASDLAANAVIHCEDLWGKLAKEKESGPISGSEPKLISAAAATAAASVTLLKSESSFNEPNSILAAAKEEPLSLVDLIEAGPDGDWKLTQTQAETDDTFHDISYDKFKVNIISSCLKFLNTARGHTLHLNITGIGEKTADTILKAQPHLNKYEDLLNLLGSKKQVDKLLLDLVHAPLGYHRRHQK